MINTDGLGKQFDDFIAVQDVCLHIAAGEVLALLGPNGAGKTTTVRMLTSVLRPTWGNARIAGYDVVSQAARVRSSVGVLTEQHGLYGRMPANDYLDFFGQIYGMSIATRQARIRRLLEDFGLQENSGQATGKYSKGMRQKLALARALLHDPPVLLLDEPTSAMDPESARLVRDSIQSLRSENRAIIICTHNLSEAEELATRIAIIRRGEIIVQGTPDDLKQLLLGSPEYEVRLATPIEDSLPGLPGDIPITSQGLDWLRYQTDQPAKTNPQLLYSLLEQGYSVVSLQEVPRSLEQVYLRAMNGGEKEVTHHVG